MFALYKCVSKHLRPLLSGKEKEGEALIHWIISNNKLNRGVPTDPHLTSHSFPRTYHSQLSGSNPPYKLSVIPYITLSGTFTPAPSD
uniref:Uncharacterized protein n=1 Tax=Picea glauca TaxID=3330 RepID=A0A124GNS0_PICGL|nr:hypothetical protein ABT39_MTgene2912 [Picea glauca]